MRIPFDSFSNTLISQLQGLTSKQATLQNEVSTGQRFTNPSDDPAAMARVLRLQTETSQLQQYQRNQNVALTINQTSYSTIQQLQSQSERAGEIAALTVGTTSPTEMSAYATETNQMIEQTLQTANSQSSGQYLFGGTKTDSPPFVATRDASGNITGVTYNGAAAGAQIRTSEGALISPYTTGDQNQKLADFMNNLVQLRDALKTGTGSAVQAVNPSLETSGNDFLTTLSDLGAQQARLQSDQTQNQSRFTQLNQLMSNDTSADIATTVVQLTQAQTAYQAALQSGAKILNMSLLNYIQ